MGCVKMKYLKYIPALYIYIYKVIYLKCRLNSTHSNSAFGNAVTPDQDIEIHGENDKIVTISIFFQTTLTSVAPHDKTHLNSRPILLSTPGC